MKSTQAFTDSGVCYWIYGEPSKPAIVMIHGFTGSHEGFQYILKYLPNYQIIIPDLPGFGISQPLDQPWTVEHLAEATNQFVASLKLKTPPYLLSHSMGGLVAAAMLAQQPKLYEKKTVFISPVATKIGKFEGRTVGAFGGALQYRLGTKIPRVAKSRKISKVATKLIMTTKDKQMRKTIYAHHIDNLDYISSIRYYHRLHVDITKRGAIDYAKELKSFDSLIITGDKDNVTPLKTERQLARAIGAKMHIIHGVGHLIHYEMAKEAAEAIDDFFQAPKLGHK